MARVDQQDNESARRWWQLHSEQLELRAEIAGEQDLDLKRGLIDSFKASRSELRALEAADEQFESGESGSGESKSIGQSVGVDELFETLGIPVEDRGSPVEILDPGGSAKPPPAKQAFLLRFAAAAAAIVLLGSFGVWLLVGRSDVDGGGFEATQTGDEVADNVASTDLESEAEELRRVVGWLGLGDVDVRVDDSVIRFSGTVPTEQDLRAIKNAVGVVPVGMTVDLSEVAVVGPAVTAGQLPPPPPPFPGPRPATPEEAEGLRLALTRSLGDAPFTFAPDSVSLTPAQVQFLDVVVVTLLKSYPGVPIVVIGHDDGGADAEENAALRLARAEAVREHLIAQGLPAFIIQTDSAESVAQSSGEPRLMIEVIDPVGQG